MQQELSALIITLNEENNIKDLLQELDFVDEIIIVDSFSTDKTIEFALQFPKVKIFQHKFEDFTKQRNIALQYATNDWILFLDADERLTFENKAEITRVIQNPNAKDAYLMYRQFYYCKKKIHFSSTQNDKNFRLFRKSKAHYDKTKKVHETLIVNGTVGYLTSKLIHYSFSSYEEYKMKMIHYGILKGQEKYNNGKNYSLYKHIFKVIFKFFKGYFLQLGILDGIAGIQIAYLKSLSDHYSYISLKESRNTFRFSDQRPI